MAFITEDAVVAARAIKLELSFLDDAGNGHMHKLIGEKLIAAAFLTVRGGRKPMRVYDPRALPDC